MPPRRARIPCASPLPACCRVRAQRLAALGPVHSRVPYGGTLPVHAWCKQIGTDTRGWEGGRKGGPWCNPCVAVRCSAWSQAGPPHGHRQSSARVPLRVRGTTSMQVALCRPCCSHVGVPRVQQLPPNHAPPPCRARGCACGALLSRAARVLCRIKQRCSRCAHRKPALASFPSTAEPMVGCTRTPFPACHGLESAKLNPP